MLARRPIGYVSNHQVGGLSVHEKEVHVITSRRPVSDVSDR